jgi:hypothetical protein
MGEFDRNTRKTRLAPEACDVLIELRAARVGASADAAGVGAG